MKTYSPVFNTSLNLEARGWVVRESWCKIRNHSNGSTWDHVWTGRQGQAAGNGFYNGPLEPRRRRVLMQLQLQRAPAQHSWPAPSCRASCRSSPSKNQQDNVCKKDFLTWPSPQSLVEVPCCFQVVTHWVRTKPSLCKPLFIQPHVSVVGQEIQSDPSGREPIILSPFS